MHPDPLQSPPKQDDELIVDFLPADLSKQTDSMSEAMKILGRECPSSVNLILDLGCGNGSSFTQFSDRVGRLRWTGLDIADSPEVRQRSEKGLSVCTYDGVHIPIADHCIDMIYSHQVFEHVKRPGELLAEVHRILKPGGYFVGSTSHLEPFHSHSVWNFTPYGFSVLLQNAGFQRILLRPGIDGITLVARRLLSFLRLGMLLDVFFRVESPLNMILEYTWRLRGMDTRKRNSVKLLFCGHFCFIAQK